MCNVTHCPIFCGNGKHECPSGFYPNGCPMEPECVKSNKPCPTFCQDDEVECQVNGQIVCIPDNMDINCPPLCPPDCDEDEKACDGPPPTATSCAGESFCIEKFDGMTGNYSKKQPQIMYFQKIIPDNKFSLQFPII